MLNLSKFILILSAMSFFFSFQAISSTCRGNTYAALVTLAELNPATDISVGAVIGSQRISIPTLNYTCGENIRNIYTATFTRAAAGQTVVSDVYSTEIPGIGIRILWPAKRSNSYFPTSYTCLSSCSEASDELVVEFVKTGKINGGTIPSGKIAEVILREATESNNSITLLTISLAMNIQITSKSCMVINPEIDVDLGSYSLSDFQGTTKQGDKIPISIVIHCPQTSSVSIAFQVANQQPIGTATGVITNTISESSGGAKNIGAKMLASNGLMAQGVTGKLSQPVTISAGTMRTFKYKTQLFIINRTNITAGKVAGRVYFNLTIQ